jgi:hypothetical protein
MNKENKSMKEKMPVNLHDVALAYESFQKTGKDIEEKVRQEAEPIRKGVNKALIPVLKYVSEKSFDTKTIMLDKQMMTSRGEVVSLNLSWDENDEIALSRFDSFLFAGPTQYQKMALNLYGYKKDEFRPIFSDYNLICSEFEKKYGQESGFKTVYEKYEREKNRAEEMVVRKIEALSPGIKNRGIQLYESVLRVPEGMLNLAAKGLMIPLSVWQEDGNNQGLFFSQVDKKLVKGPYKVKRFFGVEKVVVDKKKVNEVSNANWFLSRGVFVQKIVDESIREFEVLKTKEAFKNWMMRRER